MALHLHLKWAGWVASHYHCCVLAADILKDNWNALECDISATLLFRTVMPIVDYGIKDLGYHCVIIDDCWSVGRTAV